MGYDDEEIEAKLEALTAKVDEAIGRADAAEQKVAELEQQRPGPTSRTLPEISDDEIRERANKAAEAAWKQTGSQEQAQLAYIRAAEEAAGGSGE